MLDPSPPRLDVADRYPGWCRARESVQDLVRTIGARAVADLGGGAHPLLPHAFVAAQRLRYCLIDVSQRELAKAPAVGRKICVDITAPTEAFEAAVADSAPFDLAFSHNLLEHLRDPWAAHRNIHRLLAPGGLAVHFYPSPHNLPLTLNRLLPEAASRALLRVAQPRRRLDADQGKFPAFYAMGGRLSPAAERRLQAIGYDVVRHTGYIGHEYYDAWPALKAAERRLRLWLLRCRIPLTSSVLLVLRRR